MRGCSAHLIGCACGLRLRMINNWLATCRTHVIVYKEDFGTVTALANLVASMAPLSPTHCQQMPTIGAHGQKLAVHCQTLPQFPIAAVESVILQLRVLC